MGKAPVEDLYRVPSPQKLKPTTKYRYEWGRHLRINKQHHVVNDFRTRDYYNPIIAALVGRITKIIMRTTGRIIITFDLSSMVVCGL